MPVAPDIASEDWDLLFRAALEVLARETSLATGTDMGSGTALQPPGAVLGECVAALDHLRRSVPRCSGATTGPQGRPAAS